MSARHGFTLCYRSGWHEASVSFCPQAASAGRYTPAFTQPARQCWCSQVHARAQTENRQTASVGPINGPSVSSSGGPLCHQPIEFTVHRTVHQSGHSPSVITSASPSAGPSASPLAGPSASPSAGLSDGPSCHQSISQSINQSITRSILSSIHQCSTTSSGHRQAQRGVDNGPSGRLMIAR